MSDLTRDVTTTTDGAVRAYEELTKGRLDYTAASLAVVDEVLDQLAQYVPQMTPDQVGVVVSDFGCYVLEVARRANGGALRWFDQRKQPVLAVGEPSFRIALATWDTVEARLRGDEGASIPFLYDGFVRRSKTACPGEDALYA